MSPKKILFVLKRGNAYGHGYHHRHTSGLYNSAKFVVDALNDNGYIAEIVEVTDNNDIDREVTQFKPDVVIIEAYWVVPNKFDILTKLHPKVKWIIRGHSDFPFWAQEGIAMEWMRGYLTAGKNVFIAFNSKHVVDSLNAIERNFKSAKPVLYLPNVYEFPADLRDPADKKGFINVGCFGAVRPLKNQLLQAIAAIRYANSKGKKLNFFINNSRLEVGGEEIIKNLRNLFVNTVHTLMELEWMPRDEFLDVLADMDISLCVSLSETFCIVAADSVAVNVPLVCSSEIPWATSLSIAAPTDISSILKTMNSVTRPAFKQIANSLNRSNLVSFSDASLKAWKLIL